jgi:hypothetical protein
MRRLFDALRARTKKKKALYVIAPTDWSFCWNGYYIVKGLKEKCGLQVAVASDPGKIKNSIVHFGDRYPDLKSLSKKIDPSNFRDST